PNPYTTYATFKDPIDGLNIPSDNTLYSWGVTGTVDWDNPWGFHVKSITALEWTVGGYYFNGTNHQGGIGDLIEISLVQVPDDPSTDKNKSAFIHTEYHITDKLSTEVGVRYSDEEKT